ncbi:NACHT domain-containing protein [Colletotrichum abscissum]|uniref:NACHT domain-containing protein n=1 Tax=Colletotrichum abscissum TaxID=1671311 RepID=A0A9P9X234_9PEZI|nr:NACHT domain-containing protein [Colletotrichum abscissum]
MPSLTPTTIDSSADSSETGPGESSACDVSPQETSDYKSSVASAPSPSPASTPAAVQQAPQAMQLPEMEGGFLSKPQLGDPISRQVQDAAQQQQILPGVGSRAAPAKPAHQRLMDDMELKETLINTFRAQFDAPPEVRKWKDVWQWLEIHPIQPQMQQQLERIQASEFSTRMQQEQEQNRQQLLQRPPQPQQNGMPLNMSPYQDPPIQVTPSDNEYLSY